MTNAEKPNSLDVKQCCARAYGSDVARFLLGDSFHPGGVELTGELVNLLQLTKSSRVLDVASGKGISAFFIAENIGCRVIGVDLSEENVSQAQKEASSRGLAGLVEFYLADAEGLPFENQTFDAVLCECAFCTFPNKRKASTEFERVLKPGGRVGISDLTRTSSPLPDLDSLLAWIACIGDAQPLHTYSDWLLEAGFTNTITYDRDQCLQEVVQNIRGKLLLADVLSGLKKLDLPGLDLLRAKEFARAAADAIGARQLGYGVIVAEKSGIPSV